MSHHVIRPVNGCDLVTQFARSSYQSMASLPRILLEFLCRLRPAKDDIKRFLRRWTSLLTYLVLKIGKWRFLWPSKPGTVRNPKPTKSSFPSDRAGFSSVSGGSVCTGGIGRYAVAASAVPASVLGRERAEPESDTTPPTPALATLPVDPPWVVGPSSTSQIVGSSCADHSSGRLGIQSISYSPVRNDQPTQDPRATYRQFGPGASASRQRGRPSRSPSPISSLNPAQFHDFDTTPMGGHTYARADEIVYPTIGLQGLTDVSLSSSPR